eukprot:gb/GECG01006261.1/.p1 GENE.gb/GECG01006261.1/~~gb/GECG01006261.1/.p1  ORF type:complete len:125 (+),score=2.57 gb/GECG01006261.1/:1-375(+)
MAGRRLCLSTAMQRPSSRIAHFTHRPGVTCPTEIFARITPSSVDKRRLSVHRNLSTEGWQDTYKDAFYITTNPYFNDRKVRSVSCRQICGAVSIDATTDYSGGRVRCNIACSDSKYHQRRLVRA